MKHIDHFKKVLADFKDETRAYIDNHDDLGEEDYWRSIASFIDGYCSEKCRSFDSHMRIYHKDIQDD